MIFLFLLCLCVLLIFTVNLFFKTNVFENIITSVCLTLLLTFVLFGGILPLANHFLLITLFTVAVVFATHQTRVAFKEKLDCDKLFVLVIIIGFNHCIFILFDIWRFYIPLHLTNYTLCHGYNSVVVSISYYFWSLGW